MNERIFGLALQAMDFHGAVDTDTELKLTNDELKKFAELIVQECMRMCDVAAIGYESHGHMKEANGCYSAKEYIEEHFGVKE